MTNRKTPAPRRPYGTVDQLPSGRWRARYTGPDGLRRPLGTFGTEAEASANLAGVLSDLYRGTYKAPERGTLSVEVFARRWLPLHAAERELRPRTVAGYQDKLDRWILAPVRDGRRTIDLSAYELRALSPMLVAEWYAAVRRSVAAGIAARAAAEAARIPDLTHARAWAHATGWTTPAGKPVGATGRPPAGLLTAWRAAKAPAAAAHVRIDPNAGRRTAGQAYALLHALCAAAVRDRHIDANPCQVQGAWAVEDADVTPLTPAELEAVAHAMDPRYYAAVIVAAWSGLRAGELFALERRHILPRPSGAVAVRVEQALEEVDGQAPRVAGVKSKRSKRTVNLPPAASAVLLDHLEKYTGKTTRSLVFTTAGGRLVTRRHRTAMFKRAKRAAGVTPETRWHDLRHTGATRAAEAGATLAELQNRMGHATVRAAMIYQHATDDSDARLAERLGALEAPAPHDNVVPLHAAGGAR